MRVFQNAGLYPAYKPRLAELTRHCATFTASRQAFLADRFGACHHLLPVYRGDESAFFTNGDDVDLQRRWAKEHGMPPATALPEILLAQVEQHRSEVFYNLDPVRYGKEFLRRLPACVKHTVAWRAAPSANVDLGCYDLLVCNFPGIIESYRALGWRAEYLSPGHDPVTDAYAGRMERDVDVVFVGGYTRHHRRRAEILEAVAALSPGLKVVFHLDRSRATRVAESFIGRLLPLSRHRRPATIAAVSSPPVFGLALYDALSKARIVLNGAVDMAGIDRGNMRCFEALACGAVMVSDAGRYPDGMADDETMFTYRSPSEAVDVIERVLRSPEQGRTVAMAGTRLVRQRYSKEAQWAEFQRLVGRV